MIEAQADIRRVHPTQPDVSDLLDFHLREVARTTASEFRFAFDHSALARDTVTMFGIYANGRLQAIGALSQLGGGEIELKSMRAAAEARGKGFGRSLLAFLVDEARRRGAAALRLETGTTDDFLPANRLYASAGFIETGPFADYSASPHNRFYALEL